MLGTTFNHKILPRDYDVFSGVDVDKRSYAATFLDHEGRLKSISMASNPEQLVKTTRHLFPGKKVAFAYEAGPTGYGLYDHLTKEGFPCLVLAPSMIATAPGLRVKTNRLDSRNMAIQLRGGELRSIHVPSAIYRDLRHLVQLRDVIAHERSAYKCRIKSLLLFEGYPSSGVWNQAFLHALRSLPCRAAVKFKLNQLIDHLAASHQQAMNVQKEIRRFCRQEKELSQSIALIQSVGGLGWITSSHLLSRIGDWRLLSRAEQISSFIGLTPREDSTGDSIRRGSITRIGDPRLRSKLIQVAWVAIRKDPQLEEFYHRIYRRHPKDEAPKKAIVAVANKLCRRIFAVLKKRAPYELRPAQQQEAVCARGETRRLREREQLAF
jgi:transposase